MLFCKSCGEKVDYDSKFCRHCGTPTATSGGDGASTLADPYKTVMTDASACGAPNPEQLPEGHLIDDRYEVKAKLGRGGFGAAYCVYDRKMACDKTLQVLPGAVAWDPEAMGDIRKESEIITRLNYPRIVRVFEFREKGAFKYFDMEYVNGKNLTELKVADRDRRLPERKVRDIALRVAEALAYAHKQGVIHGDLKPRNILLSSDDKLKITGFRIAETVKNSMIRIADSGGGGIFLYMSPEQIRGKNACRESDIYSFGVVLYELLTGSPPFCRGDISYQVLNELPKPMTGVSPSLSQLVMRCLEKDYQHRFRDFEAIAGLLDSGTASASTHPATLENRTGLRPAEHVKEARAGEKKVGLAALVLIMALMFISLSIKEAKLKGSSPGPMESLKEFMTYIAEQESGDPDGTLHLSITGVTGKFVRNRQAGDIFVITGKVSNDYEMIRNTIALVGNLYSSSNKLAGTKTFYAGNVISDAELETLDIKVINERLGSRLGNGSVNTRVRPGQLIDFMVVFDQLPEDLAEFTIEPLGSIQGAAVR